MLSILSTLFTAFAVLSDKDEGEAESFEDVDVSNDAVLTMIFSKIEHGDVHEVAKMMGLCGFYDFYMGLDEGVAARLVVKKEYDTILSAIRWMAEEALRLDCAAFKGYLSQNIERIREWRCRWHIDDIENLALNSGNVDSDFMDLIKNNDDRAFLLYEFSKDYDKAASCFMDWVK